MISLCFVGCFATEWYYSVNAILLNHNITNFVIATFTLCCVVCVCGSWEIMRLLSVRNIYVLDFTVRTGFNVYNEWTLKLH